MKYLLLLVFLSGCALPNRQSQQVQVTTDIKVINCTNQFLDRNLSGKTSFDICKEIYRRQD